MAKGLALRDALRRELESFQSPYFVTLTVNRDLFPDGPEGAMTWVSENGAISEFVRLLRRGGHLLDVRYVSVLEFQMENGEGWPHWHLIFDAEFVPFDLICEAWAAAGWAGRAGLTRWGFRPPFEGKGQKPVFGGVRFRIKGKGELGKICHYLTKYVTQMPREGWPVWVLKTVKQLRRWSTSRDFWRVSAPPRAASAVTEWSKLRGKFYDPDEEWHEDGEWLVKIGKIKRSIGERVDSCGDGSVVLEEVIVSPADGSPDVLKWRWVGMVKADVWRDPDLDDPTFKLLDDLGYRWFVVSDPEGVRLLRSLVGDKDPAAQEERKAVPAWSGLLA
jgi:hypothetical protein